MTAFSISFYESIAVVHRLFLCDEWCDSLFIMSLRVVGVELSSSSKRLCQFQFGILLEIIVFCCLMVAVDSGVL